MAAAQWSWLNEPAEWAGDERSLRLRTDPKTDFWRVTHYGFTRDSGHFADTGQMGVRFQADFGAQYDQAGLMLRVDETTWLKTGIEFVGGVQHASVVVTRDFSDWSVVPLSGSPAAIWLRLKRSAETVEVAYSLDGVRYSMLRLAYLTTAERVQVGVMCAAPDGDGFRMTFEGFTIRPTPS